MLRSLLLLCTFYMPIVSVVPWPTNNSVVTQALKSIERGPWNVSAAFSNETGLSSPSLNVTGQSIEDPPNSTLGQALWPSLDLYNNFLDQCLLWDDQCIGDRTEALDSFFNNSGTLYNVVYGSHCIWSRGPDCAPWLPSPAVLPKLLEWLRQPECVQSFYEYHTQHADQPPWTWSRRAFDGWSIHTIDWNTVATTTSNAGCCKQCTIVGGNVDVYYWPVPGANSDCVSVIGSNFKDPATELVVTDNRGFPYWKVQKNPWGQNDSQNVDSITIPPEQAFPGGDANPLSAPTYIVQAREYRQNNTTIAANLSSAEVLATIGSFRCTSPSVCIGFSDIYAADECGALSTDGGVIPYTVVAFAPGELSTVQIPPWVRTSDPPKESIRSFNFADLPCPPQSVMYAMEYKPALGEPYRPVLSAPRRLSSLLPEWSKSGCIIPAAMFNGVDPPRALKPAEILTPRVTQALPSASVAAAAAPASGIRASEPKKTPVLSTTGDSDASLLSDPETKESGSKVSDPSSSNPKYANPELTDPKTSGSEGSAINESNSNEEGPHDVETTTPDLGNGAAAASQPKPHTESLDPKYAVSQPSDSQDVKPQSLDGHDNPEKPQNSNPEVSKSDDPKADRPNPDYFHPSVPDSPSNTADSSNKDSENASSNDHISNPSNSITKGTSNSDSQEAVAVNQNTNNLDPSNDEPDIKGKDAGPSRPSKSQAPDPDKTGNDKSGFKGTDDELDPFHILPSDIINLNEAPPPSATPDHSEHSTPTDPRVDRSSPNGRKPQLGRDPVDEDETSLPPRHSVKALPTEALDAMADLPRKTTSADDPNLLSPQHPPSHLPSTAPDAIESPPSKALTVDGSASVPFAVEIPETSGPTSSSASVIASAPSLHDGELDGSISFVGNGSVRAKSSGARFVAWRRLSESGMLSSALELVCASGVCVWLWLLVLL